MFSLLLRSSLEELFVDLTQQLEQPLDDVLASEVILIPHQAMKSWLQCRLADYFGIAANYQFLLPGEFVWQILKGEFPALSNSSIFDRSVLVWRILDVLPTLLSDKAFSGVRAYCIDDTNQISVMRSYRLVKKLADLYEQYLLYRPNWIQAWESNKFIYAGNDNHEIWQAKLWQALVNKAQESHRVKIMQEFFQRCDSQQLNVERLPKRISVFAVDPLSEQLMVFLHRLASLVDINFYVLNPAHYYWADVVTSKQLATLKSSWLKQNKPDLGDSYTIGNPLLASLGQQAKTWLERLLNLGDVNVHNPDSGEQLNLSGSILALVQNDIKNVRLGNPNNPTNQYDIAVDDCSIQIHSCHSRLREVQVLYDQLLELFNQNPELSPGEIIVVAPEIKQYKPYIDAVFSEPQNKQIMPYYIGGQLNADNSVIELFFALLKLKDSQFLFSEISELLLNPIIFKQYGLQESDVHLMLDWIKATNIRRGVVSAENNESLSQNTWQFGLKRMLLGYASGESNSVFYQLFPYDEIEGSDGELLGKLIAMIDWFIAIKLALNQSKTTQQWHHFLQTMIDKLVVVNTDEFNAVKLLKEGIGQLLAQTQLAKFSDVIDLSCITDFLQDFITSNYFHSLQVGVINFTNMLTIRRIPYRVMCLLGMNDGEFPGINWHEDFNLLAKYPQADDRNHALDDRSLFLDALLAAQQTFYVSFIGRNIKDNAIKQPSVLVVELVDYIKQITNAESERHWITQQPLNPFDLVYYKNNQLSKLFSYSKRWLPASNNNDDNPDTAFFNQRLEAPDQSFKTIHLNDLIQFFVNPAAYFLRHRLAIDLYQTQEDYADTEPFVLNHLEQYLLKQNLLFHLGELDQDLIYEQYQAQGTLPGGQFGKMAFNHLLHKVEQLKEQASVHQKITTKSEHHFTLKVLDFDVLAKMTLFDQQFMQLRAGKLRAVDRLQLWLHHLVLSIAYDEFKGSQLITENDCVFLTKTNDAKKIISSLLALYWQGLQQPLLFFPETAFVYANQLYKYNDVNKALQNCINVWQGNDYLMGESNKQAFELIARHLKQPLNNEFQQLASDVFLPFIKQQSTEQ